MNNYSVFYLKVNGNRPDYRVLIDFIWGDGHNVDSGGDSYNPASRTWKALYMGSREKPEEHIRISPLTDQPLIFLIQSPSVEIATHVTMFLSAETKGEIFVGEGTTRQTTFENLAKDSDTHHSILSSFTFFTERCATSARQKAA